MVKKNNIYNEKRSKDVDYDAVKELSLFADNDAQLYEQSKPIQNNLKKKMDKGIYDSGKAEKYWGYYAKKGSDKYKKVFGYGFEKPVRDEFAKQKTKEFEDQVRFGNY